MRAQEHIRAGSKRFKRAFAMTESSINLALVEHLNTHAARGVFWAHVPNGEVRAKVTGAILKRMGVKRGVPDLMFIIDGGIRFLELKRETGRLSDEQKITHDEMRAAGAAVATAYGLHEALQTLTSWGVLR